MFIDKSIHNQIPKVFILVWFYIDILCVCTNIFIDENSLFTQPKQMKRITCECDKGDDGL